jgi:hypothetical protein
MVTGLAWMLTLWIELALLVSMVTGLGWMIAGLGWAVSGLCLKKNRVQPGANRFRLDAHTLG